MARSLLLCALAVACQVPASPVTAVDAPEAEQGTPRGGVVTIDVSRMVPGGPVTFTVTGASPGELIHIARSVRGEGVGPCLGTLGGCCLDIRSPALHASGSADDAGVLVLEQELPAWLSVGTDVWFQAVVPRGDSGLSWLKSDPFATTIEDSTKNVASLEVGDLVVTEVMADPTALRGAWFEVYNASGVDVNLEGVQLIGAGAHTIRGFTYVEPYEYLVVGASDDPAVNGGAPVDVVWGEDFALAPTWGEVVLMADVGIVDAVAWDDGAAWPLGMGSSFAFGGEPDPEGNDRGENWCAEAAVYGDGDSGTPGEETACDAVADNPECSDYAELTDAYRHVDYGDGSECDSWMSDAGSWFRFTGAAGVRMPESDPGINTCGTDAAGWLNGSHPESMGETVTQEVCYSWTPGPCWQRNDIEITNCGEYYVYKLYRPLSCSYVYCGTD